MCRNERFIDLAVGAARSNPNKKNKHAALLVKGGNILAFGMNSENPIYPDSHKTMHAEVDCFYESRLRETTCNLFVAKVYSGDPATTALSQPCKDCLRFLLEETRVKKVIFTLNWRLNGKPGFRIYDLNKNREKDASPRVRPLGHRSIRYLAGGESK